MPRNRRPARVSGRATLFPTERRDLITRLAQWFAALYKASGLEQKDMAFRIHDSYAQMFRADGFDETTAQEMAAALTIDEGTISRYGKPHQMLSQGDVSFWRMWDLIKANGGDPHDLLNELQLDRNDPACLLQQSQEERELAVFITRWRQLGPLSRAWIADDMRRYAQREREEERLRSAGLRALDQALGQPESAPASETAESTETKTTDNEPQSDD